MEISSFVLAFKHYEGHPCFRVPKVVVVEAADMEAAICKVEAEHPDWYFAGCRDSWQGPACSYGIRH